MLIPSSVVFVSIIVLFNFVSFFFTFYNFLLKFSCVHPFFCWSIILWSLFWSIHQIVCLSLSKVCLSISFMKFHFDLSFGTYSSVSSFFLILFYCHVLDKMVTFSNLGEVTLYRRHLIGPRYVFSSGPHSYILYCCYCC